MIPYTKLVILILFFLKLLKKRGNLIIYRFNDKRCVIDQNDRHIIPQIQHCQTILKKKRTKFINDYLNVISDKIY